MKVFAVLALAAGATATTTGTKVQLFTAANCDANAAISTVKAALTGNECSGLSAPITVAELGKTYTSVRLSADVPNEVLLFENDSQCAAAPATFDTAQQVAFLRADSAGACLPCYRCGNVKSLKFDAVAVDSSSAPGFTPSSVLTTLFFGAAALLL
eukprot:comp24115_c0_seq1/m.43637 comp24115_c0_seq1/g.43637  ORF comp24115_c0_seq1/g.43637 comp24115_c0_seq1/m.43637 type:complete len:156 (-) comp24115_c0_seq1:328-795(-)